MSDEEVDWNKVAKELVKIIGVEGSKGLFYAFVGQSIYPLLIETINKATEKMKEGKISQEEAWREIARKLAELQSTQAPVKPPSSESEITTQLAAQLRELQKQIEELKGSRIQPTIQPTPQPVTGELAKLKFEQLKERIKTLESARNELERKKYTTLNEEEAKKVDERLKSIEDELRRLYQELEVLSVRV